jgi:hypothetical protein
LIELLDQRESQIKFRVGFPKFLKIFFLIFQKKIFKFDARVMTRALLATLAKPPFSGFLR